MPEKGGEATTLAFPPKVDAASACFRVFKFLLEEKHPFSAPNSAVGNKGLSLSLYFSPCFWPSVGRGSLREKGVFFSKEVENKKGGGEKGANYARRRYIPPFRACLSFLPRFPSPIGGGGGRFLNIVPGDILCGLGSDGGHTVPRFFLDRRKIKPPPRNLGNNI